MPNLFQEKENDQNEFNKSKKTKERNNTKKNKKTHRPSSKGPGIGTPPGLEINLDPAPR